MSAVIITLPTQRKRASRKSEIMALNKDMEVLLDQRDDARAAKPPAPVIPFVGKSAVPAIPQHELTRRVNRVLRLANSWGIGHLLKAVGPGDVA